MKTLILLSLPAVFAYMALNTANEAATVMHGDKYCAKMKDGRIVVVHEGAAITTDIILANGTQVKTDGTVIMKDGTRSTLQDGECLDKTGRMDGKEKDIKKQAY